MPGKPVFYIVKSVVEKKHAADFNRWYHEKHFPMMLELSGCLSARRFELIEGEDKFSYMAVYEFPDKETFLNYQGSAEKQQLIADYRENFGDVSELLPAGWVQIHP